MGNLLIMENEKLYNAIDYMLDGDLVSFNKTIKDVLETKVEDALEAAIHVVRSDIYNFSDKETDETKDN